MNEVTLKRQTYGARQLVTDDLLNHAAFDLERVVVETMRRTLAEAGATEVGKLEWSPYAHTFEHPRRWWERLLRRPARTYEIRGREYVMTGYGYVPAPASPS